MHAQQSEQKFPTTFQYQLVDNEMLVFLRPWGSQDYNQKFLEEVSHYLTSAIADLEVTTPFDFSENLTSLTNKLKVALLIAHDYFYKVENRTQYSIGFEFTIFFQKKNELSWISLGRFDLYQVENETVQLISSVGSDLDFRQSVLLPVDLLGVEKDIALRCGSIQITPGLKISVFSIYGQSNLVTKGEHQEQVLVPEDGQASYWSAQIELE